MGHAVEAQSSRAAKEAVAAEVIQQNKALHSLHAARARLKAAPATGPETERLRAQATASLAANKGAAQRAAKKRTAERPHGSTSR